MLIKCRTVAEIEGSAEECCLMCHHYADSYGLQGHMTAPKSIKTWCEVCCNQIGYIVSWDRKQWAQAVWIQRKLNREANTQKHDHDD